VILILNLSKTYTGGGLQVALSVLEECKNIDTHIYHVFLGKAVGDQINKDSFSRNFIFYDIPPVSYWKLHTYFKPLEKKIHPDCVFTVFGPSYWKSKAPHVMGFAYVHYIYRDYDFFRHIPVKFKIILSLKECIHIYLFKREANYIVIETEDAQQRLKRRLKSDHISVVSNTCSTHYSDFKTYPDKLPERKGGEIRLITVSAFYIHKNLISIPKVLDELQKRNINDVHFVVTIRDEAYNAIIPKKWRCHVYNVGPVPVVECPSLYRECDIVYLPTLLEIFSASYPEAMIMGKPILTSDLSFARSICGNAALYFDPFNAGDIANAIEKVIFDKTLYQLYVEKGKERLKMFPTAVQRVEQYLKICENMRKSL
jgi:glycosyltransferase involved in cell wall biosynthesis